MTAETGFMIPGTKTRLPKWALIAGAAGIAAVFLLGKKGGSTEEDYSTEEGDAAQGGFMGLLDELVNLPQGLEPETEPAISRRGGGGGSVLSEGSILGGSSLALESVLGPTFGEFLRYDRETSPSASTVAAVNAANAAFKPAGEAVQGQPFNGVPAGGQLGIFSILRSMGPASSSQAMQTPTSGGMALPTPEGGPTGLQRKPGAGTGTGSNSPSVGGKAGTPPKTTTVSTGYIRPPGDAMRLLK